MVYFLKTSKNLVIGIYIYLTVLILSELIISAFIVKLDRRTNKSRYQHLM